MKKILLVALFAGPYITHTAAQTVEELTIERDQKKMRLDSLKAEFSALQEEVNTLADEIAALTDLIMPYPKWTLGAYGTLGLNVSGFNDWLQKDAPNTTAVAIGLTSNGFANLDKEKFFWRNALNINLGWLKFDDRDNPDEQSAFRVASDAFGATSLFGYKLCSRIAASALGEYRSSLLDGRFNEPGYLDLGVGATWTPIPELVVVIHPLNYNLIFSSSEFDYQSSAGAKIVADYTQQITAGIAWRSNASVFLSYKDPDNLSNWTWVNSFSTAVKGIGLGVEAGLRGNKQEALARELQNNPLQVYYVIGLSYVLAAKSGKN